MKWLRDPLRRKRVLWRVVEVEAAVLATLLVGWWGVLLGPLLEFVVFEYVLEPHGLSGNYWERPPRQGETFRYW